MYFIFKSVIYISMLVTREGWTFWGISQKKAGKMSINESIPSVIMFKRRGAWDIDASMYHPRATWWFGVWNFKNACALHERWRFFFGTKLFVFLEKFQIRTQSMGDLQSRFPLQLKTHHYPQNMRFPPRRTSKVMKTGPFLVGSKGDQPIESGLTEPKMLFRSFET